MVFSLRLVLLQPLHYWVSDGGDHDADGQC
jgi:hypothetical protein